MREITVKNVRGSGEVIEAAIVSRRRLNPVRVVFPGQTLKVTLGRTDSLKLRRLSNKTGRVKSPWQTVARAELTQKAKKRKVTKKKTVKKKVTKKRKVVKKKSAKKKPRKKVVKKKAKKRKPAKKKTVKKKVVKKRKVAKKRKVTKKRK